MSSIDETFANGTRLHQAGNLAEAERAYRQVLAAHPTHPHALHQLGMLAMQVRQFAPATELISRAIQVDGSQPAFHANLGECLRLSGRFDDAVASYRRALALNPSMGAVHVLIASLYLDAGRNDEAVVELQHALRLQPNDPRATSRMAIALEAQGKLTEAEACYRRALELEDDAETHFRLGGLLSGQSRCEEAILAYQAAISRQPNYIEAHNNLGSVFQRLGRYAEAEPHFIAATASPTLAAGFLNLGLLRQIQKRPDEALQCFEKALEIDPRAAIAHHGIGSIREKQGRLDQAQHHFEQAVAINPQLAEAHLGLGHVFLLGRRLARTVQCCEEAIRLRPDMPEAYNNLCAAWAEQGRHDEAIEAARRGLAVRADFARLHSNLGVSLQAVGLLDEALAAHREAVACDTSLSGNHSNLLYALNYHPAYDPATIFAEHRVWAERHADPLTVASPPHTNDRTAHRRLRIGYVSPHFVAHAVNFFVQPILQSHDHEQFEVYCYFDGSQSDETTAKLKQLANHWRDIHGRENEAVAELIRQDGIDILVDLTGHIAGGHRMLLFARRPAPVQVTYIGYQTTTGMRAMDYRLTDDYADPPGTTEDFHTERLERLPTSFFCYLPSADAPPLGPLPAEANGFVTFGSVNAFAKVTPQVLETWIELLRRVPDAHLMIRADMTPSVEQRLRETFAAGGIERERLELINRLPRNEYLKLISRLDVALDPFPFNGHTTTCDCLWQGVPVVTLSGTTYVQRFGGSGLATLGLDDLIAHTPEEYVQTAVALAGDRQRLADYRATLRQRMADSPLLDFRSFTRNLEAAYRRMWQEYCARPGAE